MAEKKTSKKATRTSAPRTSSTGLSAEERAAARERVQELKAAARGADAERAVLAKIAAMKAPDRALAKRIHAIVKANAPALSAKTYYGMPAYAKDDKVVCFFKDAAKFKSRYATLGFEEAANLDEGEMWATSFALTEITPATEAKIASLVKQAVS